MTTEERIESWLNSQIDQDTRNSILKLKTEDVDELSDSFYKDLEFGTGGMRGVMGIGPNRMNKYTIGMATQGLANYLKKIFPEKASVAIAFDSRNNSQFFAETAAKILTANDIEVFLFEELRPTPELSFAVRHLNCQAGIVITASHNPREYNGYKVYWDDGAQILPPHDVGIIEEIRKISDPGSIRFEGKDELLQHLKQELDLEYLKAVKTLTHSYSYNAELSIVFSPLHGTGGTLIPSLLKDIGFAKTFVVAEQATFDGNFPTVVYPNPEEAEALSKSIDLAKQKNADLIMATDPDADRVGIAVRDSNGDYRLLNGNQTGTLLMHYLINRNQVADAYIAKTIVTTDLIDAIASNSNIGCFNTLTGFKYIAQVIRENPGKHFIAGCEESYGYMIGDFVRDKDAVSACAVIAELASSAKNEGKTLLDLLESIHSEFGLYREHLFTLTKKGKSGADEIKNMMQSYRKDPPTEINHSKVVRVKDYKDGNDYNVLTGEIRSTDLPSSNVMQFFTEDGSKISVRPSGTEPKIKYYISVNHATNSNDYASINEKLRNRIDEILTSLKLQ